MVNIKGMPVLLLLHLVGLQSLSSYLGPGVEDSIWCGNKELGKME